MLGQSAIFISNDGSKDINRGVINMLDRSHIPYTIILTKADKVPTAELQETKIKIEENLKSSITAFPEVFATSSSTKNGIEELRAFLASRN